MRLSTTQLFNRGLDTVTSGQERLAKLYDQVTTGKKIQRPGDDPVAAVQIINLKQELAINKQYQDNYGSLEQKLRTEETVLGNVLSTTQTIRDLTLQANNAAMGATEKKIIGQEIEELLGELTDLMNSRDSNGNYIFSGFQEDVQPFTQNPDGSFSYNGDDGFTEIRVSNSISIAAGDSGRMFTGIPTGRQQPEGAGDIYNTGTASLSAMSMTDRDAYNALGRDLEVVFVDDGAGGVNYEVYALDPTAATGLAGAPLASGAYVDGAPITLANEGLAFTITGTPALTTVTPPTTGPGLNATTTRTVDVEDGVSTLVSGQFQINGVSIESGGTLNDEDHFVTRVNAYSAQTGVTAVNNGGEVTFTAAPGRDIVFSASGTIGAGFLRFDDENGTPVEISADPLSETVARGDRFRIEQRAETKNLLTLVNDLVNGLQSAPTTDAGKATLDTLLQDSLNYLDVAQDNLMIKQSEIGSRRNLAENALDNAVEFELIMETTLSELQDVDYAEAISKLSQESFVLEATQQSFSKISRLSLFNFL